MAATRSRERFDSAVKSFPFQRVEIGGDKALGKWEELRRADRLFPVVLGSDENLALITEAIEHNRLNRTPEQIIAAADTLNHPESLGRKRARKGPASSSGSSC